MAEINDLLSNISNIKTDIKSAIENKGQNVTNFASYPNAIQNIVSGGSNGIKIFDSIANMQNSSNSSSGDLAIVYSSTIDNIIETTQFSEATFPETVTLSTAVSDYIGLQFKAVDESLMFDCWGEISSTRFNMNCYSDDGSGNCNDYRIEYTSSDGLTYTRTRFQKNQEDVSGNVMDFGTVIMFGSRWGEPTWDDRIGDFVKAGTTLFEGMYKYNGMNYNWANTGLNTLSDDVYKGKFYGNNIITYGTGNIINGLNIDQLKDKVNLYSNLSYLTVRNNENVQGLFESKYNLTSVPNINMINIDNTWYMFAYCSILTNIPNFDLSNIKNTSCMFQQCSNLTNIPNFNTSNVENMYSMFLYCSNLTNIPNFDTGNVTNMSNMLNSCSNLTTIPNFNTSKVIDMCRMFFYCNNLTNIPNFDTSKVVNMHSMFGSCPNLTTVPNFNTDNVNNMYCMFYSCYNLTNVPEFNTSNVINMVAMFSYCNNLTSVPNFNTSKIQSLSETFFYCNNLTSVPNWNTSNVTSMFRAFYSCKNIATIPLLDTGNVISMANMFTDCYNLRDIPLLNMNKVTQCYGMFSSCSNLSDSAYANIISNKGYFEFLPNWYTVIYS